MEPKNWGRFGWGFIHNVALGYPTEITYMKKEQYRKFFEVIGDVLPCLDCQNHYKKMFIDYPPVMINKDTLFKWTVDIHNKVNERIGKKTVTVEEAYNIWMNTNIIEKKQEVISDNKLYYISFIFFLILLAIVLIILYFHTA